MVPMTKEEWEKERSTVRRVVDPESGRVRSVTSQTYVIYCNLHKRATASGIFLGI